jgi:hypothetical protein
VYRRKSTTPIALGGYLWREAERDVGTRGCRVALFLPRQSPTPQPNPLPRSVNIVGDLRGGELKALAGFLFLFAVGMVLNAIDGKWAFDRTQEGGKWVALDLLIAGGVFVGGLILWNVGRQRQLRRVYRDEVEL